MKEEKSVVVFNNPKALVAFMEQPKIKIAEAITGALASERSELILASGRIIQGVLKGNAMSQFSREVNELIKKGRIKEDYAEGRYGFKSLSDILSSIDEDAPDEDKFRAIKALFYSVNSVDAEKNDEFLRYQLLRVALSLSSSQLVTLEACYRLRDSEAYKGSGIVGIGQWLRDVAHEAGHDLNSIVEMDEDVLVGKKIISARTFPDKSGIHNVNCRLTDIGIMLGENILKYDFNIEYKSEETKEAEVDIEDKK